MSTIRPKALFSALLSVFIAAMAQAQDATFQSFFFDVCAAPVGGSQLETRCSQSNGGDLSSDSENSLNPNQSVSIRQNALERARLRALTVQRRGAARRDEEKSQEARASSWSSARRPIRVPSVGTAAANWPETRLGAGTAAVLAGTSATTNTALGGWSIFLGGRGTLLDREETSRERGFDGFEAGADLGADYRISDRTVAGFLFSYEHLDFDFDADEPGVGFQPFGSEGSREGDGYFFTLFGSHSVTDAFYVDASFGGGVSDYEFERDVVFQNSTRTIAIPVNTSADTDGYEISAEGGAGYEVGLGPFLLDPYARLRYVRTHIDDFSEDGGSGLGMHFSSDTLDSLSTVLGMRTSYAISTAFGVLVPQVHAEWEHEYLRDEPKISAVYLQDFTGTRFEIRGDTPDQNIANLGGGVTVVLPGGWMGFVDYQALLGHKNLESHRITGGVRIEL